MNLLNRLLDLFESPAADSGEPPALELATAMLLYEVVWADHEVTPEEREQMRGALSRTLHLSMDEADTVARDAEARQAEHVGVFEYTRLVNEHTNAEEKFELVTNLWRVAFADGTASAIEEHIIRRISELLYLPHPDFIRAKQIARS